MRAEPIASRLYAQTVVEHERRLPVPGEVLVGAGDHVESGDVIARGQERGPLHVVDAAQALGVARDALPHCLRVQVGQEVREGQVLAAGGFMGWRTALAPVAGRVAGVAAGRVFLEETPRPIELRANLPGQVVRVLPGQGAVIRAVVARLVGIWGAGGESYGPLVLRSSTPADSLHWISVDLACRGKIVVAGCCLDKRALLRAARLRALGLVVGGLAEELRAVALELGLVVVVTDGLGAVPMAGPVFELLAAHEGDDALATGGRDGPAARLPELDIPLGGVRGPVHVAPDRPLAVGDRVRVTRAPYLGATGHVQAIVEAEGEVWARVTLDGDEQTVAVAYRNLERLG